MNKKIYRSTKDKWLTGLCGGIADFFNINPLIIRLLMFLIACSVFGIIVYFVVSYFVPVEGSDRIEAEFKDADENK